MTGSKLPNTKESIFSTMSKLAREEEAINLSQGFPDFDIDNTLSELAFKYMKAGNNQYAPMPGIVELREQIALKYEKLYNYKLNINENIVVTSGATQALFTAITALVHKNDEVVVITPAYDCYIPAIKLCGGKVIETAIDLNTFNINWAELKTKITSQTKMLIVNNPHNPSGYVFSQQDILELENIVKAFPHLIILSDEVYEHIVFDGKPHLSVLGNKHIRNNALATFSFGKTFHATGWKTGYIIGATHLINEFKKVHQYNVFSVNTPIQYALAEYMQKHANYKAISNMYEAKRNLFINAINHEKLNIKPSTGSYYQLINFTKLSDKTDVVLAKELTRKIKVASIPISPFYFTNKPDKTLLRFCLAKQDETLLKAAEKINMLGEYV